MVNKVRSLAFFVVLAGTNLRAVPAFAVSVLEAPVADLEVAPLGMLLLLGAMKLGMLVIDVVDREALSGATHRVGNVADLTVGAVCILEAHSVLEHIRVDVVAVVLLVVIGVGPPEGLHLFVGPLVLHEQTVVVLCELVVVAHGILVMSVVPVMNAFDSFLKVPVEGAAGSILILHWLLVCVSSRGQKHTE